MSDLIQCPTAKYWTTQWNPVIGCKPCSPACENCYAAAWARRFGQSFEPHESSQARPPRKGVVFCGNMTDLFGRWTDDVDCFDWPTEYIRRSLGYFGRAVYLWLTKRVRSMCDALNNGRVFLKSDDDCDFAFRDCEMQNQFFGFTAENQEWYDVRATQAAQGFPDWANLWLSCEPLLGEIDLDFPMMPQLPKWLVVGCESGPNRRPCKIEWVESIVEQCRAAGVPVFVKQICLPNGKFTNKIEEFPAHLRIRQVPWAKEGETDGSK